MQERMFQLIALTLFVLCFFGNTASAQRRRASNRAAAPRLILAPLTAEQKEAIANLVSKADELETTYKYRPRDFAEEAGVLLSRCAEVTEHLPDGQARIIASRMGQAYDDAGLLYGTVTGTSLRARTYESGNRLLRREGRETFDYIGPILRRYGVERLSPYQAQGVVLNRASALKDSLRNILRRSPTTHDEQSSAFPPDSSAGAAQGRVNPDKVTAEQVEREVQRLTKEIDDLVRNANAEGLAQPTEFSDWIFPKQGMRGNYNQHTKGVIYEVGDGILAGHMTLDGQQGQPSIALVLFLVRVPESVASNFDLALIAASKTVTLPLNERLADMVIGWENDSGFRTHNDYRFHAAGGKVVGVTLARDRKAAIVRFLKGQ